MTLAAAEIPMARMAIHCINSGVRKCDSAESCGRLRANSLSIPAFHRLTVVSSAAAGRALIACATRQMTSKISSLADHSGISLLESDRDRGEVGGDMVVKKSLREKLGSECVYE